MGFEMDTVSLSTHEVLEKMRVNPDAHAEFRKARSNYSAAGVLGFAGALLVSVPLVTAVVGGAFIVVSVPLNWSFQRHALNALDVYNKQFESTRIKTNLYFTGTGARLVIRF